MNTTQDIINKEYFKSFWNFHKSRLKYKEEIEKLVPFVNQVKKVAKRNMNPDYKNDETEKDLELLINKIINSYITEKINTEQFLNLIKLNSNIQVTDDRSPLYRELEVIINIIRLKKNKFIEDRLIYLKMKYVFHIYKKLK